jgi:hypothetical protein
MRCRVAHLMFCAFALMGRSTSASEPKVILLESYSDARPIGMSHYTAEIIAGLGVPGLLSGDELRTKVEANFSRPASKATPDDLQALVKSATDATNAFGASNFNIAVTQLGQVVDSLAREPAALVANPKLREVRKEALLTLAKALAKMRRDGEAKAVLEEAVRSYTDLEFSETLLPPNIVQLGKSVQKERAAHSSTLEIVTSPPGKRVFLDEQPIGVTPITKSGLLPGTYRVYFPSMGTNARGAYRTVDVSSSGKPTALTVSSEIEDHLEMQEYVGLRFSSAAQQREAEVPIACAVAQALGLEKDKPSDEIIILTRQRSPAAEAELMGAIYDVRGHRKWASIIPLAPNAPDDTTLARFAKSLRLRREVEGVKAAPPPEPASAAAVAPPSTKAAPTAPGAEERDDRFQFHYRFGGNAAGARYLKTWYGVSFGFAVAMTGAFVGSYYGYGCSGPTGADRLSGPCGPQTTGRDVTGAFFSLTLLGWAASAAVLIVTLIDYLDQRSLFKKGYTIVGESAVPTMVFGDSRQPSGTAPVVVNLRF